MKRFRNKYRTTSSRLKNYDYSSDGAYFITICTKNRKHFFGEIVHGTLPETPQSQICEKTWNDLLEQYSNIMLDEFVIMPNHVHGIIMIINNDFDSHPMNVEAIHELPLRVRTYRRNMIIPKIIGRFKMQTAKQINILQKTQGIPFWQKNYHDRIIRNEDELNRIREYIQKNPENWERDCNKEVETVHELSLARII